MRSLAKSLVLVVAASGCTAPHIIDVDAGVDSGTGEMPDASHDCTSAACCKPPLEWTREMCAPPDPCSSNHGGCDLHASCTVQDGHAVCGACEAGFSVNKANKCDPALVTLEANVGMLNPPFDPDITEYTILTGLASEKVVLTAGAHAKVTLRFDAGTSSDAGGQTFVLEPFAKLDVRLKLTGDNDQTRTYLVHLARVPGVPAQLNESAAPAKANFGNSLAVSGDTLVVGEFGDCSGAKGVNGNEHDASAQESGAAYVYRFDGARWKKEAYLKASNTESEDFFGTSVAIDGDLIAVGAPVEASGLASGDGQQDDNTMPYSGAVYIFKRSNGAWAQEAYLKARHPSADSSFGTSVALTGSTLAVGAEGDPSAIGGVNAPNAETNREMYYAGAAYIFSRGADGTWTQEAFVKADHPGNSNDFGHVVALSADTLVVGAPQENGGARTINGSQAAQTGPQSGAIYVFRKANGTWAQEAYIKSSNSDPADSFGSSVSLKGNVLAVGAAQEDGSASPVAQMSGNAEPDSGAVYVFQRTGKTWSEVAYLKREGAAAGDQFGTSVSLCGKEGLFVGAPWVSTSNPHVAEAGSAFFFGQTSKWLQRGELPHPHPSPRATFGYAVTCSERYWISGAVNDGGDGTGSAFVFR